MKMVDTMVGIERNGVLNESNLRNNRFAERRTPEGLYQAMINPDDLFDLYLPSGDDLFNLTAEEVMEAATSEYNRFALKDGSKQKREIESIRLQAISEGRAIGRSRTFEDIFEILRRCSGGVANDRAAWVAERSVIDKITARLKELSEEGLRDIGAER